MSTTWINRGHFYCPHVRPILVDCNFIVDSTNGNGLGIRNLKGQGIQNIFMYTSATPGKGPNGLLNPNPQSGVIMVQFADNYQRYYGGFDGFVSPVSGSALAVDATNLTPGNLYTIVSVGTSTAADWLALGVQPGVTPAVGVSFIALVSGAGSGSGSVEAPAAAGSAINHIEAVGDANKTIGPIPVGGSPNVGGFIYLACFQKSFTYNSGTPASSTVQNAIAAPANNSVISLSFYMNQSNVVVAGE